MEDLFPGYYGLKDADRDRLWHEAVIVLDANILLNLYRYSPSTRDDLLGLLHRMQSRLWLPHQVGLEFHKNRHTVIIDQMDACKSILPALGAILCQIDDPRKHPFLDPSLRAKVGAIVKELQTALNSSHDVLGGFLSADPICDALTQIYAGRVGSPYTAAVLEERRQLAEERYSKRVPPGFEDRKKDDSERFGDFILWMQLLDQAGTTKTPFLFVTDDNKPDWWWRLKGQTFGPRPELKAEIMATSGQPFHMYTCTRFMEYAKQFLDTTLKQSAIDEVRKASEATFVALQQQAEAFRKEAAASALTLNPQQFTAFCRQTAANSLTLDQQQIEAFCGQTAANSLALDQQQIDALRVEASTRPFDFLHLQHSIAEALRAAQAAHGASLASTMLESALAAQAAHAASARSSMLEAALAARAACAASSSATVLDRAPSPQTVPAPAAHDVNRVAQPNSGSPDCPAPQSDDST
ncbi:MAG: hypothetical protein IMZ62_09785 [Chloroflexi bacterium]|nr:hypothetical protein [Chloroflexota bacterium]